MTWLDGFRARVLAAAAADGIIPMEPRESAFVYALLEDAQRGITVARDRHAIDSGRADDWLRRCAEGPSEFLPEIAASSPSDGLGRIARAELGTPGPRPLSKKQAIFVRELREGRKVPEASRAAGINISTGWSWLDEPRIKAAVEAKSETRS